MIFNEHEQRLRKAEEDFVAAMAQLEKIHELTALEWTGVVLQLQVHYIARAVADALKQAPAAGEEGDDAPP